MVVQHPRADVPLYIGKWCESECPPDAVQSHLAPASVPRDAPNAHEATNAHAAPPGLLGSAKARRAAVLSRVFPTFMGSLNNFLNSPDGNPRFRGVSLVSLPLVNEDTFRVYGAHCTCAFLKPPGAPGAGSIRPASRRALLKSPHLAVIRPAWSRGGLIVPAWVANSPVGAVSIAPAGHSPIRYHVRQADLAPPVGVPQEHSFGI